MQSEFARDLADPDQPIHDALKERPGKPLKIRIQPMILRTTAPGKSPQYVGWRDERWTLDCDSVAEAFAVRDAMRAFFETLGRLGPSAVHQALSAINAVHRMDDPKKGGKADV